MPWILVTHKAFGINAQVPVNTDMVCYARPSIQGDPGQGAPTILHMEDGSELPIAETVTWFWTAVKSEN